MLVYATRKEVLASSPPPVSAKNSSSFKSGAKKCAKIAVITFLSCPLKSSAIWGKLTIQIWKVRRGCFNGHIPKTPKHKYLLSCDIERWKWLKNVINHTTICRFVHCILHSLILTWHWIFSDICHLVAGSKSDYFSKSNSTKCLLSHWENNRFCCYSKRKTNSHL